VELNQLNRRHLMDNTAITLAYYNMHAANYTEEEESWFRVFLRKE